MGDTKGTYNLQSCMYPSVAYIPLEVGISCRDRISKSSISVKDFKYHSTMIGQKGMCLFKILSTESSVTNYVLSLFFACNAKVGREEVLTISSSRL